MARIEYMPSNGYAQVGNLQADFIFLAIILKSTMRCLNRSALT